MASTMNNERIETIDNLIKVFFSKFHEVDKEIRKHESKNTGNMNPPSWMSSYNFMCLPNLTKAIQKYGPLSNLWEGSLIQEKILSLTKDKFVGFCKNWSKNLLEKMSRTLALERVLDSRSGRNNHCENDENDQYNSFAENASCYYSYRSKYHVVESLNLNEVLSLVFLVITHLIE